ncbi:MAG: TerB family tellurite resistance protein [Gammaproteobacteria bacterium]|nr:TerB family tellurite resistance protein [Gammaproteobacteria bacterium]NNF61010.1 TerB family tellurite resistance protein [Gammaproteobacteria bacterium]NNM21076.1 TerB family tellurite resistance protein [Gammaproteobacteria bacterium]
MLKKLRELLGGVAAEAADDADGDGLLRVATAALLVEMARADFSEDGIEHEEIVRALQQHFALDLAAAQQLLRGAGDSADKAVSLHQFTRLLHEQLEPPEKQKIVEMLWRVALADAVLDKHEDHLVRKIADLLYVSHADLVRLKHRVLGELDAGKA